MKEFEDLTHEQKVIVLSLFAFQTGCLFYNVASLLITFRDTSDETKQYYIKSMKEFIKMYNLLFKDEYRDHLHL